jgi:hypothetical protein
MAAVLAALTLGGGGMALATTGSFKSGTVLTAAGTMAIQVATESLA